MIIFINYVQSNIKFNIKQNNTIQQLKKKINAKDKFQK